MFLPTLSHLSAVSQESLCGTEKCGLLGSRCPGRTQEVLELGTNNLEPRFQHTICPPFQSLQLILLPVSAVISKSFWYRELTAATR